MLRKEELFNIEEELKANNTKIAIFHIPTIIDRINSQWVNTTTTFKYIAEVIRRLEANGDTISDFYSPYIVIQELNYHRYGKLSGISIIVDDLEGPSSHNNSLEIALTHEQGWIYRYPYASDWEFADDDNSAIMNILTILENAVNNDKEYIIQTVER